MHFKLAVIVPAITGTGLQFLALGHRVVWFVPNLLVVAVPTAAMASHQSLSQLAPFFFRVAVPDKVDEVDFFAIQVVAGDVRSNNFPDVRLELNLRHFFVVLHKIVHRMITMLDLE